MTIDVHHVVDGPADGRPVLLSNSIGSNLEIWEPQVKPLVDNGFQVIRYDTRGHGRSPSPDGPYTIADLGNDVLALLDTLGVGAADVIGTSLGGMTALWLAQQAPSRTRTIVPCCTSARPGNTQMWTDRAVKVRQEGLSEVADGSLGRWFTQPWLDANPQRAREIRDAVAATSAKGYAACCDLLSTLDLTAGLAAITAPTLVISGTEDPALPPEHGRAIADGIPGAGFAVIDRASHIASLEQPDEFNALILDHLKDN